MRQKKQTNFLLSVHMPGSACLEFLGKFSQLTLSNVLISTNILGMFFFCVYVFFFFFNVWPPLTQVICEETNAFILICSYVVDPATFPASNRVSADLIYL